MSYAEKQSFLFSKSISNYRSFAPDLINKVELISQENEIKQLGFAISKKTNATAVTESGGKVLTINTSSSGTTKVAVGTVIPQPPITTVNRIIFVDGAPSSKDKNFKNRRKDDAQRERVIRFLQNSIGISMSSANPDNLPVLISELPWLELRGLSTALSMSVAEVSSFIANHPSSKRSLKLVISELRHRASIVIESATNSSVAVASGSQPNISVKNDSQSLYYAMLYSSKDDRFDMVSYTYSVVSHPVFC